MVEDASTVCSIGHLVCRIRLCFVNTNKILHMVIDWFLDEDVVDCRRMLFFLKSLDRSYPSRPQQKEACLEHVVEDASTMYAVLVILYVVFDCVL